MTFDEFARFVDVRLALRRPADSQHLSSYRTVLLYIQWITEQVMLVAAGLGAIVLFYYSLVFLGLTSVLWLGGLAAVGISIIGLALAEGTYWQLLLMRWNQREAHGTARWANYEDLVQAKLLRRRAPSHAPEAIKLGEFGWKYDIAFPVEQMCCHVAVFGPPQSGKSVSFFVPVIRQWASVGSVFCLDTKGELFKYTGRAFKYVYRLDLENPLLSDRLNLVGACRHNPEIAGEIASIVVGLDEKAKNAKDPFWPQAETALLKALLMYLALTYERADVAMARALLAHLSVDALGELLYNSGDPDVIEAWLLFLKAKPELQGSIMIGLSTTLEPFNSPNARVLFTPPTQEEKDAGVAELDLERLREKGVGAYLVVAEGTAERLHMVMSAIFGTVSAVLRRSGVGGDPTPCLIAIDEAGNFTIPHLAARVGVGRSLGTAYFLGYQGISQPYSRMGHDGADAVFDSVGTMIFLPGLGQKTCEYASRRLDKTTTWALTSVDAVGKTLDSERLQEVSRDLMSPSEIRRMLKHVEALMVVGSVPPVHFKIPKPELEGNMAYPQTYRIPDPAKPYRSVVDEEPPPPPPPSDAGREPAATDAGRTDQSAPEPLAEPSSTAEAREEARGGESARGRTRKGARRKAAGAATPIEADPAASEPPLEVWTEDGCRYEVREGAATPVTAADSCAAGGEAQAEGEERGGSAVATFLQS